MATKPSDRQRKRESKRSSILKPSNQEETTVLNNDETTRLLRKKKRVSFCNKKSIKLFDKGENKDEDEDNNENRLSQVDKTSLSLLHMQVDSSLETSAISPNQTRCDPKFNHNFGEEIRGVAEKQDSFSYKKLCVSDSPSVTFNKTNRIVSEMDMTNRNSSCMELEDLSNASGLSDNRNISLATCNNGEMESSIDDVTISNNSLFQQFNGNPDSKRIPSNSLENTIDSSLDAQMFLNLNKKKNQTPDKSLNVGSRPEKTHVISRNIESENVLEMMSDSSQSFSDRIEKQILSKSLENTIDSSLNAQMFLNLNKKKNQTPDKSLNAQSHPEKTCVNSGDINNDSVIQKMSDINQSFSNRNEDCEKQNDNLHNKTVSTLKEDNGKDQGKISLDFSPAKNLQNKILKSLDSSELNNQGNISPQISPNRNEFTTERVPPTPEDKSLGEGDTPSFVIKMRSLTTNLSATKIQEYDQSLNNTQDTFTKNTSNHSQNLNVKFDKITLAADKNEIQPNDEDQSENLIHKEMSPTYPITDNQHVVNTQTPKSTTNENTNSNNTFIVTPTKSSSLNSQKHTPQTNQTNKIVSHSKQKSKDRRRTYTISRNVLVNNETYVKESRNSSPTFENIVISKVDKYQSPSPTFEGMVISKAETDEPSPKILKVLVSPNRPNEVGMNTEPLKTIPDSERLGKLTLKDNETILISNDKTNWLDEDSEFMRPKSPIANSSIFPQNALADSSIANSTTDVVKKDATVNLSPIAVNKSGSKENVQTLLNENELSKKDNSNLEPVGSEGNLTIIQPTEAINTKAINNHQLEKPTNDTLSSNQNEMDINQELSSGTADVLHKSPENFFHTQKSQKPSVVEDIEVASVDLNISVAANTRSRTKNSLSNTINSGVSKACMNGNENSTLSKTLPTLTTTQKPKKRGRPRKQNINNSSILPPDSFKSNVSDENTHTPYLCVREQDKSTNIEALSAVHQVVDKSTSQTDTISLPVVNKPRSQTNTVSLPVVNKTTSQTDTVSLPVIDKSTSQTNIKSLPVDFNRIDTSDAIKERTDGLVPEDTDHLINSSSHQTLPDGATCNTKENSSHNHGNSLKSTISSHDASKEDNNIVPQNEDPHIEMSQNEFKAPSHDASHIAKSNVEPVNLTSNHHLSSANISNYRSFLKLPSEASNLEDTPDSSTDITSTDITFEPNETSSMTSFDDGCSWTSSTISKKRRRKGRAKIYRPKKAKPSATSLQKFDEKLTAILEDVKDEIQSHSFIFPKIRIKLTDFKYQDFECTVDSNGRLKCCMLQSNYKKGWEVQADKSLLQTFSRAAQAVFHKNECKNINDLPQVLRKLSTHLKAWKPIVELFYNLDNKYLGSVTWGTNRVSLDFIFTETVLSYLKLHIDYDVEEEAPKLQYSLEHHECHYILDDLKRLFMNTYERSGDIVTCCESVFQDYSEKPVDLNKVVRKERGFTLYLDI